MRRWALPVVLLILVVVAGLLAWRADADEGLRPSPSNDAAPVTPVLSARRMPVWLLRPGGAERLDLALQDFLAQSPKPVCLAVESGGRRIIDVSPNDALAPASNVKLLVAAAALEQLGADAVFTTTAASQSDVDDDGSLDGDLWLLGGGDPVLATADYVAGLEVPDQPHTQLEALADAVVAEGVTTINGGVIGDDTRYDNARTIETWPDRSLTRSKPGPLSALSVNDGFESYPTDPESDEAPQASDDPPRLAAEVFTGLLEERGVEVNNEPQAGVAPDDLLTLATVDSPPLREIVHQLLGSSDNTSAELLTKEIGLQRSGEGSTAAGTQAIVDILSGIGLPTESVVLRDGSGLHDGDRVTCALLIAVLDRAGPDSDISAGLSVAGESGTLAERFLDSFVTGRLRAKTGFLDESTALSGYVETLAGLDLAFAYVANSNDADLDEDDVALQDLLANALVRYPEGPTVDDVSPVPPDGATSTTTPGR